MTGGTQGVKGDGRLLTEGDLAEDGLLILGVNGSRHVRGYKARGHRIAGDVARRKLSCHCLCEADHSSLAHSTAFVPCHSKSIHLTHHMILTRDPKVLPRLFFQTACNNVELLH